MLQISQEPLATSCVACAAPSRKAASRSGRLKIGLHQGLIANLATK